MNQPTIILDDFRRFTPSTAIGAEGDETRWQICRNVYGARNQTILRAPAGSELPAIRIDPGVAGWYEIRVSLFPAKSNRFAGQIPKDADGIFVRLDTDPAYTTLYTVHDQAVPQDLYVRCADLTGRSIELANFGRSTQIDYLALIPLSDDQMERYRQSIGAGAEKEVAGINDFNCVAEHHFPKGEEARACILAHAEAGFTTVYHKCYAVRCEYHSNVEERVLADGKPIGRLLTRYDPLPVVVETGHRAGLKVLGWMRIANEFSHTPSPEDLKHMPDFFKLPQFHRDHPEMVMVHKDGSKTARLSFAWPEVRERKIAIAREILGYGVAGLMIDVLRHPPMVMWEPPLVAAYREQAGRDPLAMPGDGAEDWLRFRADAFTQFLRELRTMMDGQARRLELAVRIVPEPWRALRDGCDVEVWMREKLVDTVIASYYGTMPGTVQEILDVRPMRNLTAGRARLLVNVWRYGELSSAAVLARQAYDQGADGVTFYESDYLVLNPERRRRLREFRSTSLIQPPTTRPDK